MRNKVAKFLQRVTSTTGEYRRAKRFWNRVPHNEKPGFKDSLKREYWVREKIRSYKEAPIQVTR